MAKSMNRRKFLKTFGAGALVLAGAACAPGAPSPTAAPAKPAATTAPPAPAPTTAPAAPAPTAAPKPTVAPAPAATVAAKPAAQSGRLVLALNTFLTETPYGWRTTTSEKQIWDPVYDCLIMRDPKTGEYTPGLALSWTPSTDYKTWTFKLRQGIMFHENYGEMTAEDVKFTVEQNLKPDANGADAGFFKADLAGITTPDKYTVVMQFKRSLWEIPSHFSQLRGYLNVVSKKHLEALGEEKAAQHPIGTGPYRHVESRRGDFHRFEALPNHWRQTPAFKELVFRRIQEAGGALAGLRAGEIDIAAVTGDYLKQAKAAGLRIIESPNAQQFWIILPGQSVPQYEDYSPTSPWVGDLKDPKSLENAKKVRLALNLAVNKQAIYDNLWNGMGGGTPFSYYYYPFHKGYSNEWKVPPYDPQRAKQLLAEAGVPNGFEIKMNPLAALDVDVADNLEAVILDWDKIGVKVKRVPEELGTFSPKGRARKTGVVGRSYSPPAASDEPFLSWGRTIHTKGTFNLLAEGPFDSQLDAIAGEMDAEKRTKLTAALGTQLYQEYRGVMIGMKSATFAVTKKVGAWPLLPYTSYVSNLDYITPGA